MPGPKIVNFIKLSARCDFLTGLYKVSGPTWNGVRLSPITRLQVFDSVNVWFIIPCYKNNLLSSLFGANDCPSNFENVDRAE